MKEKGTVEGSTQTTEVTALIKVLEKCLEMKIPEIVVVTDLHYV